MKWVAFFFSCAKRNPSTQKKKMKTKLETNLTRGAIKHIKSLRSVDIWCSMKLWSHVSRNVMNKPLENPIFKLRKIGGKMTKKMKKKLKNQKIYIYIKKKKLVGYNVNG